MRKLLILFYLWCYALVKVHTHRLHHSALVILGQKLHANSTMPTNLKLRLQQGVNTLFENNCTCIIMSGGGEDSNLRPEAQVMSEEFLSLLEECDMKAIQELIEKMQPEIVVECESKNTIEVNEISVLNLSAL